MALWFRAEFYNSHHCFLTYLQWGVKNTLFFPLNSSFCRLKIHVCFDYFFSEICVSCGFRPRKKETVLFFCLDCLTRCVSLTKKHAFVKTYAEISIS